MTKRSLIHLAAFSLLVIVSILAFGEQARRCRYHFDGGRGWDLPQASVQDMYRPRAHRPCLGPVAIIPRLTLLQFVGIVAPPLPARVVLDIPATSHQFRAPPLAS